MFGPFVKGVDICTDLWGNQSLRGRKVDATQSDLNTLKEFPAFQPWMATKAFVLVNTIELLRWCVDQAIANKACVVDLETKGLDNRVYDGKIVHEIVGIALCFDRDHGWYVPCRHDPDVDEKGNLPWELVRVELQRLLKGCLIIYHNSDFDQETLWAEGFEVPEEDTAFDDTQLMVFLSDSNRKRLGLKSCSEDMLGMKQIEFKELFPKGTRTPRFDELHPEDSVVYASSDGICTFMLWELLKENPIFKEQSLIYKIEKRLVAVVRRMERNRFHIDTDYLRALDASLEILSNKLVEDIRKLCNDPELNIDSPKQLGETLFDKLKIPNASKTGEDGKGKQYKTDRQTLEELDKKFNGKYPALTKVVKYRQLQKVRGTYINNLVNNVDKYGDARFGIMTCGAPTGRFAAPGGDADQGFSGVNVQSIPKVSKDKEGHDVKPNLRRAFRGRMGFIIAAIDFAGVELRIAGNLSQEPKWISEFNHLECQQKYGDDWEVIGLSILDQRCPYCGQKKGDVHSQTSLAVFGTADEPYRGKSKGVNFGILYGAGGRTIAENTGLPPDEGFRIVKAFMDALSAIKRWIKGQHDQAHKQGKVKTAFGRVRLIPEVKSGEKGLVAFGERTAVNTVVQGGSADITKIAMVGCDKLITSRKWENDCRMLLTVHDEIVFEVRETMKDVILPALAETMCKCSPKGWKIPLCVDIEYGETWDVDQKWDPPPPRLRPRRQNAQPLPNKKAILVDQEQLRQDSNRPAPEEPVEESVAVAAIPTSQASQQIPSPVDTPTISSDTPTHHIEAPVEYVPTPSEQGTEPTKVYIHKHCQPYTEYKWRKLEAVIILASVPPTSSVKARLKLVSERGKDLTGVREIYVDVSQFDMLAKMFGV